MAVRNCADIGENMRRIIDRLLANDNLIKLLYYTDKDPLSHDALTDEQKRELIFEKLIKFTPHVGPKETAHSVLVLKVEDGRTLYENKEFRVVRFKVDTFCPLTQFAIKNENLRPFAIMGEVERSLKDKTVNGLGKLKGGDFDLSFITDDVICYTQLFSVSVYE